MARASSQTSWCAVCSHTHSRQPSSLETWTRSPLLAASGDGEVARRRGALAPQQLPRIPRANNPAGSQSRPPPHLRFFFPKMGAPNRGAVVSSLGVPFSPPHPHAEAAKKMTAAGVGAGRSRSRAQRTLTHCGTPQPPGPARPTAETSLPSCPHPQPPLPPLTPSLAWDVPLTQSSPSEESGNKSVAFSGIARELKRQRASSWPRERRRGYKPWSSGQSQPERPG